MREFMQIVESILIEGRVHEIDTGYNGVYHPVRIYQSPSRAQATTLATKALHSGLIYLRGIQYRGKTIYVCDGADATHDDMLKNFLPHVESHSSDYTTFEIRNYEMRSLTPTIGDVRIVTVRWGDYDVDSNPIVQGIVQACTAVLAQGATDVTEDHGLLEDAHGPLTVEGFIQWFENNYDENLEDDIERMGGIESFIDIMNKWISEFPETLTLYRGLHVPDVESWMKNPARENGGLGIYWTDEYEVAVNENGPDGGYSRNDADHKTNLIMTAQVPHSSVDWNATVAIRTLDSEEPEITLKAGGAVHVSEIHLIDFSPEDRRTIGRDHVTKTIPVGKSFRA